MMPLEPLRRVVWLNDVHLNFLQPPEVGAHLAEVRSVEPDCVLIGGDIAEAPAILDRLAEYESVLQRPIYFVLGNHDYYGGSIAAVRREVSARCADSPHLRWLSGVGVIPLTERTTLVGHDGWGDARLGGYWTSDVVLNDFVLIEELADLSRQELQRRLQALGDEAAAHFRRVLPKALERSDHVVVLTHVPPFREAAWFNGRYSDDNWLPFFACHAVGEVLCDVLRRRPEKRMTVLCGHTHGKGTSQILPNLWTRTGPAKYGQPRIQQVFECW